VINFQVKENIQSAEASRKMFHKINALQKLEILVGIPESRTARKSGEMNNATLLYIHTKGSPVNNLPARPLIEPALSDPSNADKLSDDLSSIAQLALAGKPEQAKRLMSATGMDAVNMIRGWFDDPKNGWEPNKPSTVRRKMNKLKGKKKAAAFEAFASGEFVDSILVDSGAMRKAITYVLREKD
jgi:hypothetical protein